MVPQPFLFGSGSVLPVLPTILMSACEHRCSRHRHTYKNPTTFEALKGVLQGPSEFSFDSILKIFPFLFGEMNFPNSIEFKKFWVQKFLAKNDIWL